MSLVRKAVKVWFIQVNEEVMTWVFMQDNQVHKVILLIFQA